MATALLGCHDETTIDQPPLRLGVTTTTRDSGLLEVLLPDFEAARGARVTVIAAGTGKILALGRAGELDVLLVHEPQAEQKFMQQQHGTRRELVMSNHFQLLGPAEDPAEVRQLSVEEAFSRIAARQQRFLSRGDSSGTHQRELQLWRTLGIVPAWSGYLETGQGAGPTVIMADQLRGYTLCDRGTYLKFREVIALVPLGRESSRPVNRYSAIAVNGDKHPAIQPALADQFIEYLISPDTQRKIGAYRVAGETLFTPARIPGTSTEPE